jgi:hypothetical protein
LRGKERQRARTSAVSSFTPRPYRISRARIDVVRFVSLAFVLVACAGSPPAAKPAPGDRLEQRLRALDAYAERACACADRACAEALDDEIAADLPATSTPRLFESADATIRADAAMQRSIACMWQRGVVAFSFEVVPREVTDGLRDRACGCAAPPCVDSVLPEESLRWLHLNAVPVHEAVREAMSKVHDAAEACRAPRDEPIVAAVRDLEAIRERGCACADAACATGVRGDLDAWMERYKDVRSSQQQVDQGAAIARELKACLERAAGETP